jgi:hypothetical protein
MKTVLMCNISIHINTYHRTRGEVQLIDVWLCEPTALQNACAHQARRTTQDGNTHARID